MRIAILVIALIAVGAVILMRLAADRKTVHHKDHQPRAGDPSQAKPPFPDDDPGPAAASGDPVPGSREDRRSHGAP